MTGSERAMLDFFALALQCAPQVHQDTMRRIVQVESSYNPLAIGVVGARLERQPRSLDEAVETARNLEANGYNFSVGLAQVNKSNFERYGLDLHAAFDPCRNLQAGAGILAECYSRARNDRAEQDALRAAMSCYYSGNFLTGFAHGYVNRIVAAQGPPRQVLPVVPALELGPAKATPVTTVSPVTGAPNRKPAAGIRWAAPATPSPPQAPESTEPPSALLF